MSAPDILANMSRGWNRDPAGVTVGTMRTGVSIGLWEVEEDGVHDIHPPEAENATHIVASILSQFNCVTTLDGVVSSSGKHAPGMATLVPAGRRPRAVVTGRHRILHFYVPHRFLTDLVQEAELGLSGELELVGPALAPDPVIAGLGRSVLSELRSKQPLSRLRIDCLGQDLAIHLLRRWSNLKGAAASARERNKSGLAPWQLRRVTECLDAHFADDVPLTALAQLVELSPNHFCTAFRISLGEPPHRYLVRRRIERAREMLADPRLSITEVALAVGFGSSAHFATAFRKQVGVTPTEYRRDRLT